MTSSLSPQVNNIVQAFRSWDEEGTGRITREDLETLIRALLPDLSDPDLEKLFDALGAAGMPTEDLRYEDFILWLYQPVAEETSTRQPVETYDSEEIDEEARRRGLWQAELVAAAERACREYPEDKVRQYFREVSARLESEEYLSHVKGQYFQCVDLDHDGKISFIEAASVIAKSLKCVADIEGSHELPRMKDIRRAFDAHDTLVFGRGHMGADEFLNLMRYLQVRVAAAALPMSKYFRP
mmetsp:Transcript_78277/g.162593  ORF Transcript_78277/g.162593 Transcript_78277/m.162593 type:complete len:240 (-) Transcript_78277:249-968(-)